MSPDKVHQLLDELCVELGFCLSSVEYDRLTQDPPLDARQFANEIYRAEGLDPETADIGLWRKVRNRILQRLDAHRKL